MRNFMATLLLSQGVPMIRGGDELSHTQGGNNNAYCQDNAISWLRWELTREERKFLEFTRKMIRLQREHPVLRRRKFLQGRAIRGSGVKDIVWIGPNGAEMKDRMWGQGNVRSLGMLLAGDAMNEVDDDGEPVVDDTFLVLLTAHHEPVPFKLRALPPGCFWERLFDTTEPDAPERRFRSGHRYALRARSLALFRLVARARLPR
jgi:glycogen operon protein